MMELWYQVQSCFLLGKGFEPYLVSFQEHE